MTTFADGLKHWRNTRRLSQLGLAVAAGVSSRHISFLETGRAGPSREMVLHLAQALEVPRAARNGLLGAAGFAPVYGRQPLDSDAMAPVRAAMLRTISRHDPYPAVVLDQVWRLVALNRSATWLMGILGLGEGDSLLDFAADPQRAAGLIVNWGEVGHHTLLRLRNESLHAGGIAALDRAAERLAQDPAVAAWRPTGPLPPVIPARLRVGDVELSLFSTLAQFGSAEDIALADMQIELMFPADEASRALLERPEAG